jgi:hypothetical protein
MALATFGQQQISNATMIWRSSRSGLLGLSQSVRQPSGAWARPIGSKKGK